MSKHPTSKRSVDEIEAGAVQPSSDQTQLSSLASYNNDTNQNNENYNTNNVNNISSSIGSNTPRFSFIASPSTTLSTTSNNNNLFTQKLKSLYRAQDMLPKLIEDESIPEQKMDDYYVNLQIMLGSKNSSDDKKPINLGQIFDKVEDQEATSKVLITGGAGIGKTTLLHHISYEWAKDSNGIFNNKFDYVFKVRLKKLTTNDWNISAGDKDEPLAELIYKSLVEQNLNIKDNIGGKSSGKMNKAEIKEFNKQLAGMLNDTEQQSKILLLLDGYDEIAHLTNNKGNIAYEIIDEIFAMPNINVVMTSRPNALTPQMSDRFTRKIETTGLDQNSALEYINKYFTHHLSIVSTDESSLIGDI